MSDYYIERGQHLPSAAPIRARLKLLIHFLEHEQAAGSSPSLSLLPDQRCGNEKAPQKRGFSKLFDGGRSKD